MYWIFCMISWALCPTVVFNAPVTAPGTGNIVTWLTETEHDFGEVRAGSTVQFIFKFQNKLTEPIVLQNVRTTCGCTAADWPETPVAAGEAGEIRVEFDGDHGGAFRKKITVFFNKQRKPEVLWIQGVVQ